MPRCPRPPDRTAVAEDPSPRLTPRAAARANIRTHPLVRAHRAHLPGRPRLPEMRRHLSVIAYITKIAVVRKIIAHLGLPSAPAELAPARLPSELVFDVDVDEQRATERIAFICPTGHRVAKTACNRYHCGLKDVRRMEHRIGIDQARPLVGRGYGGCISFGQAITQTIGAKVWE